MKHTFSSFLFYYLVFFSWKCKGKHEEFFLYDSKITLSFATLFNWTFNASTSLVTFLELMLVFSYQSSLFPIAWLWSQPRWWLVYSIVPLACFSLAWCSLSQIVLGYPKVVSGTVFTKVLCWSRNFLGDTWLSWIIFLFNLICGL